MEILGERPVWSMSGGEMVSTLDATYAEIARLETLALHLTAGIETTGYAKELGAGTTARFLTFRYRIDATKARRDVQLALALPKYPAVAAALPDPSPETPADEFVEDGPGSGVLLHPAQAEAIVSALDKLPGTVPVGDLAVAEREMVELGRTHGPLDLRKAGIQIRNRLDTDGPEPAEQEAYDRETLKLKTADNGVAFNGFLANESAELFRTLIHTHAKPHKTVDGALDPRNRDKRQADALTTILNTSTAACPRTAATARTPEPGDAPSAPGTAPTTNNPPDPLPGLSTHAAPSTTDRKSAHPTTNTSPTDSGSTSDSGDGSASASVSASDSTGGSESGSRSESDGPIGSDIAGQSSASRSASASGNGDGSASASLSASDGTGSSESGSRSESGGPIGSGSAGESSGGTGGSGGIDSGSATETGSGGVIPGHGAKPQIIVTIDFDDLKAATANATGRLIYGDALSAATIRRLACDAQILPVVLGSDSQPLNLGTSVRLATGPMRKALIARDNGCVCCGAPPIYCDAHHVLSWIDGGETKLANLVLLCKRCHRDLHAGHWNIRITNGIVHVTRPTWATPDPVPRARYRPPTTPPDTPRPGTPMRGTQTPGTGTPGTPMPGTGTPGGPRPGAPMPGPTAEVTRTGRPVRAWPRDSDPPWITAEETARLNPWGDTSGEEPKHQQQDSTREPWSPLVPANGLDPWSEGSGAMPDDDSREPVGRAAAVRVNVWGEAIGDRPVQADKHSAASFDPWGDLAPGCNDGRDTGADTSVTVLATQPSGETKGSCGNNTAA
ncbi:MAG TPA: DUF222 domain-containing protein [Kribbella sp.]